CKAGGPMNRYELRAREAQSKKSFESYAALCRKTLSGIGDRLIGEGFMRASWAEAAGVRGVVVHDPDMPPPSRLEECDIELNASYGELRFRAATRSADVEALRALWLRFDEAPLDPLERRR